MAELKKDPFASLDSIYNDLNEMWRLGIKKACGDMRWYKYDLIIMQVINEYTKNLVDRGFTPPDWHLIKAMLWTETGAVTNGVDNLVWLKKPMQIGNRNDPAMQVVLSGTECTDLVVPTDTRKKLTSEKITTDPYFNIFAGIGYLLSRFAHCNMVEEADLQENEVHEYTVTKGDNLFSIAKNNGTTEASLKQESGLLSDSLKLSQVLKYKKMHTTKKISSWDVLTPEEVAKRYNGGGDTKYAKKL